MDWFEKTIEDIERIATLTVDDVVYDTAPLDAIIIKVFHHTTLEVLDTYTLADGEVEKVAPTTSGQIRFVVPGSVTAEGKIGKYFYQIHTTEVDADFPDNTRNRSFIGWCFGLRHSV